MTVYVSEQHNGDHLYFMWADDIDEAVIAAACIGLDTTRIIQRNPSCWAHYLLTAVQFADAIIWGATITDRYGPSEWMNRRAGNMEFVARIEELREWRKQGNG